MSLKIIPGVKLTHKETKEVLVYRLDIANLHDISYAKNGYEWSATMNDWLNDYDKEDIFLLYDYDSGSIFKLDFLSTVN